MTAPRPFRAPLARMGLLALCCALAAPAAPAIANDQPAPRRDTATIALDQLRSDGVTARLAADGSSLRAGAIQSSLSTTVARFTQTYRGIPVLGAEAIVRLRSGRALGSTDGTVPGLNLDVSPAATPSLAWSRHVARASARPGEGTSYDDQGLVILPRGRGVLTRHLSVAGVNPSTGLPTRREVFVSTTSRAPVLSYNSVMGFSAADPDGPVATTASGYNGPNLPLTVTHRNGTYLLDDTTTPGELQTFRSKADAGSLPLDFSADQLVSTSALPFANDVSESGAIDAQWGAARVLDWYRSKFARVSLDGHGMTVKSYVGLVYLGEPMANAAWTGTEMIYGSGDADFKPFSASLDIVGHEMTHGVVQHSANLLYYGQPGAVNEGLADYFGNAIGDETNGTNPSDPTYSLMGEDICRHDAPVACAKFDLSKPVSTADYYQGDNDEQGVHINSPIISTALWSIRLQLGGAVADKLAYVALTQFLTANAGFTDVRTAMLAAARDQGLSAADTAVVAGAFDRNGIVPGWDTYRAGSGAKVARLGLTYPSAKIAISGRKVVSTNLADDDTAVVVSTSSHPNGRVLFRHKAGTIDDIATDGRQVIAIASRARGYSVRSKVRVNNLRDGRGRTVADYSHSSLSVLRVGISRSAYAWQTREYGGKVPTDTLTVKLRPGRTYTLASDGPITSWSLVGNRLVYAADGGRRLVSVDVLSGQARTLWRTPEAPKRAKVTPNIRHVALAEDEVAVVANLRAGEPKSLLTIPLSGGAPTTVIRETGPRATPISELDASPRSITFQAAGDTLWQVRVGGSQARQVSCGPTAYDWVQGNGTTVAWVNQQFGKSGVLVRSRPAGTC